MTRFAYIRRDGRCVLRADGHADFCPGKDIVCAGASALVCALAGALDALGAQGTQPSQRTTGPMCARRLPWP